MAKGKKYEFQVKQDNASWTAEIVRKITSKRSAISKRQSGFSSESEAQEWGQKELKALLQNLHEKNKHRSKQHQQKPTQ